MNSLDLSIVQEKLSFIPFFHLPQKMISYFSGIFIKLNPFDYDTSRPIAHQAFKKLDLGRFELPDLGRWIFVVLAMLFQLSYRSLYENTLFNLLIYLGKNKNRNKKVKSGPSRSSQMTTGKNRIRVKICPKFYCQSSWLKTLDRKNFWKN